MSRPRPSSFLTGRRSRVPSRPHLFEHLCSHHSFTTPTRLLTDVARPSLACSLSFSASPPLPPLFSFTLNICRFVEYSASSGVQSHV